VSGASIVLGTFLAGLQGQFLAVCASPLLFLAVVYSFYRRTLPELRLRPQLRFDAALLRSSVSVGAAAVISTFAMQLSLSATRVALNAHGGAEANGQFQAAWSIESAYLMVVLQGLSTVVFPRYASAKDSRELQTEVNTAVDLVFRVVPPLILTVMAFRELAVHILFSDRFDVAAKIVGFQMVGDFAKVLAWVQAGPLLYRGKVKAFLFTEGAATLLLVVLPPVLVMHFGTVGACAGFGIAYLVYVAITRVALRTACEVVVPWRMTLATMGFGGVLLGLLVLADATLWFRLTLLLAAGIWAWRARVWRLGRRPA
jgi:PST family polysaccharide transporter